jgi:hypothetical protein
MPKPCSERNRLQEIYYQATIDASNSSLAVRSVALGPEFVAALNYAEAAYLVCRDARHAFEEHCKEHGCDAEFQGAD